MSETPPPSFYGTSSGSEQEPPTQAYSATPEPRRSPGRGLVAGMLAGSLLIGGAAGLGGAAIYDQWIDDDASSVADDSTQDDSAVAPRDSSKVAATGEVEAVAEKVLPSVVRIDVAGSQESGSGSGIILTPDGQILTNEHVVSAAGDGARITVSFQDGTRAEAEVLGSDPLTDTAVLQAKDVSGLTPATIGNSADLRVGQPVVAIGSPFGLDATVTSGIVSALDRPVSVSKDQQGNSTTYPAIQTDAAINPGNSGGPLVDMNGNVVGINSSIRSASSASGGQAGSIGLGFAIPIDEILPIVDQMAAGETPTHARMGVSVGDAVNDANSDSLGALVSEVTPDSSADKAGIEVGDIITKVDDNTIDSSDDLVATVRGYRPGDEVQVTFLRDGEEQTVDMELSSD